MSNKKAIARIEQFSPAKRELFTRMLKSRVSTKKMDKYQSKKIMAFVLEDRDFDKYEVKDYLKLHLPGYMIPEEIISLEQFPTLANGKLDVNQLSELQKSSETEYESVAPPSNEIEKTLVKIWEDIMHFQPVSIHDNFFEIGGDSIISIQMIAKARKAGILIDNEKLLSHQTINDLAKYVTFESSNTVEQEVEQYEGLVPLSPIQSWFFEEHLLAPHHWNLALSLEILDKKLNPDILRVAIKNLLESFDGLRLQFDLENGAYTAKISNAHIFDPFQVVDLISVPENERGTTFRKKIESVQSSLNLSKGALFQAIYFCYEQERSDVLVLIAHHLVMDNLSWTAVLKNIEENSSRIISSGLHELSITRGATYRSWVEEVKKLSESGFFNSEYDFWKGQQEALEPFPVDQESGLPIDEMSVNTAHLKFDEKITNLLLHNSYLAYNTSTEELLVVAVLTAFKKWKGISNLCLGFEKHGRHPIGSITEDLSSCVGWFTTYFPLTLRCEHEQGMSSMITYVKEQLRSVPNNGLGYGALRYMDAKRNNEKALDQNPPVVFNFLGNKTQNPGKLLGQSEAIDFNSRSPMSERSYLIEINLFVENDCLRLMLSYSELVYRESTIKALTETFDDVLRSVVQHCMDQKDAQHTASDFPESELSPEDLEKLLNPQ